MVFLLVMSTNTNYLKSLTSWLDYEKENTCPVFNYPKYFQRQELFLKDKLWLLLHLTVTLTCKLLLLCTEELPGGWAVPTAVTVGVSVGGAQEPHRTRALGKLWVLPVSQSQLVQLSPVSAGWLLSGGRLASRKITSAISQHWAQVSTSL